MTGKAEKSNGGDCDGDEEAIEAKLRLSSLCENDFSGLRSFWLLLPGFEFTGSDRGGRKRNRVFIC